jgi:hypothetical protein
VTPLLVVVTPTKLALRQQPDGVTVVSSKQLMHHLDRLDRTLSGADVASISDVADRDTTWQTTQGPAEDVHQLADDFAALRAAVRQSIRTRVLWGVVALVVVAICAWVGTATVVQHMSSR